MPRLVDELFFDLTARTRGLEEPIRRSQREIRSFRESLSGSRGATANLTAFGLAANAAGQGIRSLSTVARLDPLKGLAFGTERAQKNTAKLTKSLAGPAGLAAALAIFGAAAVAAGAKAARMAGDLDRSLREVSTLLPDTVENLGGLRREVIALSTQTPETPEILTRGLYQAISAGINDTSEALGVLRVSAQAATAGLSDTFTSVDAITTVLNAYQLEASEAARVSDVFFTTIKEGKLQFGDIASVIGTVATSASLAGVSIEEVGAGLATLTKFGLSAGESANALNRFLLSVTQATDDQVAAARRMGFEFTTTALSTKGLVGFMQDLEEATGGNIDALAEINPNIRAARAAFVLAGKGAAEYGRILRETNDSSGATLTAFEKMQGSLENQQKILDNQINKLWLEFGEKTLPIVIAALTALNNLLESDADKLARLYERIGDEQKALEIRVGETRRRLAEELGNTQGDLEAQIRAFARLPVELQRQIRTGRDNLRTGQLADIGLQLTSQDKEALFPDLVSVKSLEQAQELVDQARVYAEALRESRDFTELQERQLAQIILRQQEISVAIDAQIRGEESLALLSRNEDQRLAELQRRRAALATGGPALADEVKQVEELIALRENELELNEANRDLAEQLTRARADSLEDAQARVAALARQEAEATQETRGAISATREEFERTVQAYQRVNDLEKARASIGREITRNIAAENEELAKLRQGLRETADDLTALLFPDLAPDIAVARLRIDELQNSLEGLITFIRDNKDELRLPSGVERIEGVPAFDDVSRVKAFRVELEEAVRSTQGVGQQALVVQGLLDKWKITVEDLPEPLQAMVRALIEIGVLTADADSEAQKLIQDISFLARATIQLANAFKLVDDEAASVVNSVSLIAEGIGRIKAGDVLQGLGGIVGGIAGVVDTLFGGPSPEELARRRIDEENLVRLRQLRDSMDALRDVMLNVPGNVANAFANAFEQIETPGGGPFGAARGVVELRELIRILSDEGITITDLEKLAETTGINAETFLDLLDKISRGEDVAPAAVNDAFDQAERLFEALEIGFVDLFDTVAGRLALLQNEFDRFDIDAPADQLRILADSLAGFKTALTAEEIERLARGDEALIEQLLREVTSGTGRFTEIGDFGQLTPQQLLNLLDEIESIADRLEAEGAAEGDFQNVSAVNRLTVEQGDRLISLQGTTVAHLEAIRSILEFSFSQSNPLLVLNDLPVGQDLGTISIELTATGDTPVSQENAEIVVDALADELIDRGLGVNLRTTERGFGAVPVRTE